jgi:hypothetical protein
MVINPSMTEIRVIRDAWITPKTNDRSSDQ